MYQRVSDTLPLLLAVVSTLCLGVTLATRQCDLSGRPHPGGFCGARLARIRRNVCSVMRIYHPEFFQNNVASASGSGSRSGEKRSAPTIHTKPVNHQKLSKVLQILQKVLTSVERAEQIEQSEIPLQTDLDFGQGESLPYLEHEAQGSFEFWPHAEFLSEENLEEASWLKELLTGRVKREATPVSGQILSRRKRDLVCDCCFNQCTFQQVALYC